MRFKKGDRVIYTTGDIIFKNGQEPIGTCKAIDGKVFLVDFDEPIYQKCDGMPCGHNGSSRCKSRCGYWCHINDLKLMENVEKPNEHYEASIQPIEFMQANLTHDEFIGFLKGNIIKYVARCGKKDNVDKEVAKIIEYAKWLSEAYKGEVIDPRMSN